MDIPQGNGTFVTGVGAANTGSGIIDAGSVTDRSAWVPDTYTISFTSETTYDVLDSSSNVVASGTYAPDGAIAFNGIQVQLSGAPAAGDTFTVTPSGKQDIFTTISNLITTLGRPADTDADNARFVTEIGTALAQLDRTQEHISTVRAEVGGRLSVLDSAADTRADRELDLQTALGSLRDLDYADAIARLNMQLTGLQAAQQSYTKISQLSLFNYI
jgi:flagellar hook-associated protein 3 FlgL